MGLKNVDATYQRTMQKCLQSQIGRNVHVYVDNIIIETNTEPLAGSTRENPGAPSGDPGASGSAQ